jgi:hypothetical protein
LGPVTAVIVLVVIGILLKRPSVVSRRLSVNKTSNRRSPGSDLRRSKRIRQEDLVTSRYRTGLDAGGKAGSPDSAADTPGSAASTRAGADCADANLVCCAASETVNITKSL